MWKNKSKFFHSSLCFFVKFVKFLNTNTGYFPIRYEWIIDRWSSITVFLKIRQLYNLLTVDIRVSIFLKVRT